MRPLFYSFVLLLFFAGCNAPIKVQTSVPRQSDEFNSGQLREDGLAVLPSSTKEYTDVIAQNTELYLRKYVGNSYLTPGSSAKILNDTNTLAAYKDAIDTYEKTGIGEEKKFKKVGVALKSRYLLKVDFDKITSTRRTESDAFDDKIDSYETRQSMVSAVIIDCSNGEIVWEGISRSQASENGLHTIRQSNREFVQKSIEGLMKKLFNETNA